jgi:hypothetical protein
MAKILVLIPINPKLPKLLKNHCHFLTTRLKNANPSHELEIIFDSRGSGWDYKEKDFQ